MYKILFNLHTNSKRELLLFIQMFHRSETLRGFRACLGSIGTHPGDWIAIQQFRAMKLYLSLTTCWCKWMHSTEFRKSCICRDSESTKCKGNKPVRTESWEAETLITSLATLTRLPKEELRYKEDILPCLFLCFFSVKWEKKN